MSRSRGALAIHAEVVEDDVASAGIGEPGNDAEQGRFSGTRGAEQDEKFSIVDVGAEVVDDLGFPEALADVA